MDAAFMSAGALLVALAIDRVLGEPPARLHPVVGMGNYLGACSRWIAPPADARAPDRDGRAFTRGIAAWTVGALGVAGIAFGLQQILASLPGWLALVLLGLLLKPLLAWRMLRSEVQAVEMALAQSLDAGRTRLAWLVSRDVTQLSAAGVRESAIESLAENLNDSVVAPLFWFVVAGLPGAALYRFANTADAMWGYRGDRGGRRWEWAGKWAARADDVLSWLPARLTALGLALAAGGLRPATLRAEAGRTPSPNGGWPMGAMALALDVRLGKPGVYALHAAGRSPHEGDVARAIAFAGRALTLLVATAVAVLLVRGVWP